MMRAKLTIAVDGPAASGKGTIARALAAHYGLPHLDTGLLYRAVGVRAGEGADAAAAVAVARALDPAWLADPSLRSELAGHLGSRISSIPDVRAALLAFQQSFAADVDGAVLDGRDIGTVIAPNATAKLYVTADIGVRARRRAAETGRNPTLLVSELAARDARDTARATAPLLRAADADLLDTSEMAIDTAVRRAIALVEARIERAREHP